MVAGKRMFDWAASAQDFGYVFWGRLTLTVGILIESWCPVGFGYEYSFAGTKRDASRSAGSSNSFRALRFRPSGVA